VIWDWIEAIIVIANEMKQSVPEDYRPGTIGSAVNSKLLLNYLFLRSQMASQARHDDHSKYSK